MLMLTPQWTAGYASLPYCRRSASSDAPTLLHQAVPSVTSRNPWYAPHGIGCTLREEAEAAVPLHNPHARTRNKVAVAPRTLTCTQVAGAAPAEGELTPQQLRDVRHCTVTRRTEKKVIAAIDLYMSWCRLKCTGHR